MKKTHFLLLLLTLLLTQSAAAQKRKSANEQPQVRTVIPLNYGWKFHAGDAENAAAESLSDADWRTVDLPHDFQIEQPWVEPDASERPNNADPGANIRSRLSSRGFKEMGMGWYRLHITPPDSLRGKRLLLDFEGIMLVGDVYLNGTKIAQTDYGYVGFEVDVTDLLRFGQDNVLAVCANTQQPGNSRWYTGGGLYREVHLVATDPQLYFARHPLFITTPEVGSGSATVAVQAEVHAPFDSKTKQLSLHLRIADAQGKTVFEGDRQPRYNARMKTAEYALEPIALTNPHLWDTDDPYLYTLTATLLRPDGTVADVATQAFGVRTIEFSPQFGMKLNGKKVLLKGIANHHTLGALGAAAYDDAMELRIRLLKHYGFNHIRTSHNPYSASLLDLCDRYGILVVDELYDKWLTQYAGGRTDWTLQWQKDLPEWVKRDRNHPSVVLWSLGNELQTYPQLPYGDWGVTPYRLMRPLMQRYDSTRLVTVAMHPRGRSWETDSLPCELAKITDIQAYNYRYMYFPGDSKNFPYMIFYQSEASTAALGPNWFEMDLDKVIGSAYWGAIDYLGESQGWPAKGWAQGLFDITLQPKPTAFMLKSMFSDQPTVHIGVFESGETQDWNGIRTGVNRVSENWNRTPGTPLSIVAYTNADEVELRLNGKTIATQKNPVSDPKRRNQLRFDGIDYEPGTLLAIARNGGKEVARHELQTTGDALSLRITPVLDEPLAPTIDAATASETSAQKPRLTHLRITAVDKQGRRVRTAKNLVSLALEGNARIVAVDNGDMNHSDLNVAQQIHLAEGSALVIVRTDQPRQRFTLTATADGLKKATHTATAK